jgi:hypothetical protein
MAGNKAKLRQRPETGILQEDLSNKGLRMLLF